jgi:hypothetical protein
VEWSLNAIELGLIGADRALWSLRDWCCSGLPEVIARSIPEPDVFPSCAFASANGMVEAFGD